jgi:hypothetical protein
MLIFFKLYTQALLCEDPKAEKNKKKKAPVKKEKKDTKVSLLK